MAPLKVLISGAGIAGNALAFWLSRLGHDVTVIERFPNLRATGLQIDLRGHGIEVLRRMGLEQSFRSKSAPEQGMQIVGKSGRRLAYFPANESGQGTQGFTSEFEIMRGDLCNLIYDPTKDRAKYVFGTSIESFEQNDSSVQIRFTDGKTGSFDLLVGADGQGSCTRRMMLGSDSADALIPLGGDYIAYFTIPRPMQEGEGYIGTMYTSPGRAVMTRRHSPHTIQVYLICYSNSDRLQGVRRGDVKEEKKAVSKFFQGAGWQTDELLKSMQDADDFYCERMGIVKMKNWSRGCVTLVGDAASCPSANTGMGTTSGIVGAYVLAGEIGRHCADSNISDADNGIAAALKAYEQKFQPFMGQVQKGVEEGKGPERLMSMSLGIVALNCFMAVASFFKLNPFKWLLKEDVKGWDLPEYEEMVKSEGID